MTICRVRFGAVTIWLMTICRMIARQTLATICQASPALSCPVSSTYRVQVCSAIKAEYITLYASSLLPESLLQVYLLSIVTKALFQLADSNTVVLSHHRHRPASPGPRLCPQLPRPLY